MGSLEIGGNGDQLPAAPDCRGLRDFGWIPLLDVILDAAAILAAKGIGREDDGSRESWSRSLPSSEVISDIGLTECILKPRDTVEEVCWHFLICGYVTIMAYALVTIPMVLSGLNRKF